MEMVTSRSESLHYTIVTLQGENFLFHKKNIMNWKQMSIDEAGRAKCLALLSSQ